MNISVDAGVTVCTAARAVRSPIDSVQVSPGSLAEVSLLVADLRRLAYPRTHSAGNAFSCASTNGLIFIACALVFHGVTSTTSLRNISSLGGRMRWRTCGLRLRTPCARATFASKLTLGQCRLRMMGRKPCPSTFSLPNGFKAGSQVIGLGKPLQLLLHQNRLRENGCGERSRAGM